MIFLKYHKQTSKNWFDFNVFKIFDNFDSVSLLSIYFAMNVWELSFGISNLEEIFLGDLSMWSIGFKTQ